MPNEQSGVDPNAAHIAEASHRLGLPERWIRAVMAAESNGFVRAVSSKGAMGLMQIMPETWVELSARYGLDGDPYDPRDNILAGTAYLRELYDRYGSPGFLAAYNAGPARYDEYLADGRPLPVETRNFVAALTPYIYASGASLAAIPPQINRNDWTQAPLFIATSNDGVASDSASTSVIPKTKPAAPSGERDERLAPDASGLFVAPSRARERP
ncbi:lytic transglycosylase domain-containing protein [Hoeflea alexandrii]|uniref:lytic transglycosylase domain-containing protein n=1 Tax=Hoeflea alexandrii TaxID=288436 RepID=UPI003D2F5E0B